VAERGAVEHRRLARLPRFDVDPEALRAASRFGSKLKTGLGFGVGGRDQQDDAAVYRAGSQFVVVLNGEGEGARCFVSVADGSARHGGRQEDRKDWNPNS